MARGRPIAAAVVWRAEMRAAFEHLAGNLDLRLARVVALLLPPAAWVFRNAAGFWRISFVFWRVPVACPFPDIADHVVEAIAVRRKGSHRRGAFKAVGHRVF